MRALWLALAIGAAAFAANAPPLAMAEPGSGGGGPDFEEPDLPDLEEPDLPDAIDEPDLPDLDDAPDVEELPDMDEPEVEAPDIDEPETEALDIDETENDALEAEDASEGPDDDHSGPGGGDDDAMDAPDDDDRGGGGDDNHGPGGGGHDDDDDDHDNHDNHDNENHHGGEGSNSGPGSSGSGSGDSSGSGGGGDDVVDLVERHRSGPIEIESDEVGHEFVAREVLLAGPPNDVAMAESQGYRLISDEPMGDDNQRLARLVAPDRMTTNEAVAYLQAAVATSIVTPNTIYRSTQAASARPTSSQALSRRTPRDIVIGVVDTGVDASAVSESLVAARGFAPGGYAPRNHGNSVASILADQAVRIRVADVFGATAGGDPVASASAIAAGLQWLIDARVPVINISIEGPQNEILRRIIADAAHQGFVVVAAAGNGGPLADPAFPAAYDGAVAVTAVDHDGHAYPRANRGDYVDFAAFGVRVPVQLADGTVSVSGTSFAAPIVAVRIAERLHAPSPADAQRAIEEVRNGAEDRGAPGRDPIYGWGVVRTN